MSFLSVLAKTFALALAGFHPWTAVGLWLVGLAADAIAIRRAGPTAGVKGMLVGTALLQGASLAVGWLVLTGGEYAAMRWKDGVPVFAAVVAWLVDCCGMVAGSRDGMVLLTTMAGPQEFAASLDAMALVVPLIFLAQSLVRMWWAGVPAGESLRRAGVVAAVLLALALVRMTALVLVANVLFDFAGYETEELPYGPLMDAATGRLFHLPLLLAAGVLLGKLLGRPAPATVAEGVSMPVWLKWGMVPAMGVLALAICWQPAGEPKQGKVVLNTWHAQWSRCDRPYDRDWYGADSGYNYACVKRLFERFYPVQLATSRLTARDLDGASTLVIFDPDRRFDAGEIKLVRDFVREGGGLLVVGDHTNVFGSATHLNELCEPFGFQFRDDVLFDLASPWKTLGQPKPPPAPPGTPPKPGVEDMQDEDFHQVLDAPAVASAAWHGMEFFKLRGPASIRPTSLWTRPVYQARHAKSVRAIYSVNNFYPPPHDDPKMRTGDFCVAATVPYGRGRVAAWGDSTVFSNFEIFYPGKYEYLLNTMNWLNHREPAFGALARRLGLLVLCGGTLALLVLFRRPGAWLGVASALAVALAAGWGAARLAESRSAGFPQPVTPSEWVVFAAESKDKAHNLRGFVSKEPYDKRYEVFIQWVLRTGAMSGFHVLDAPRGNGLYQHLRDSGKARVARALIVRTPDDLPQLDQLAAMPAATGDPVLLMFGSAVPVAQAVAAVQRCGLLGSDSAAANIATAWPNGEALVEEGGRRVLVVAGADRFSDQAMGISEKVVPDAGQRALFDQAFGLIDRLFGRGPAASP
jgi:hypothetical protein